jgi:hypothetical protein
MKVVEIGDAHRRISKFGFGNNNEVFPRMSVQMYRWNGRNKFLLIISKASRLFALSSYNVACKFLATRVKHVSCVLAITPSRAIPRESDQTVNMHKTLPTEDQKSKQVTTPDLHKATSILCLFRNAGTRYKNTQPATKKVSL